MEKDEAHQPALFRSPFSPMFFMTEQLEQDLNAARQAAAEAIASAASVDDLRQAESKLTGKKGTLGQLLGIIGKLPPEQRGPVGQQINQVKKEIVEQFAEARAKLESSGAKKPKPGEQTYDPTLPGRVVPRGSVHPVTAVQWEFEDIFARIGFVVASGPEMETDFYNFDALNIPADHPARDQWDTFWLDNGWLLRTHTSPCQIRAMQHHGAPLRIIVPGRCFRYETEDASHANTFHQLEGLMIDRGISIAHLVGVMKLMLSQIFHAEVKVRLRPGYFPFVEPGFELDMGCLLCQTDGCAFCKYSGWVELLGCGMVHPRVLEYGGIDAETYTGFAFGLGLTRLAMMKYGVRDIRGLNSGDLRAIVRPEQRFGPAIIEKE